MMLTEQKPNTSDGAVLRRRTAASAVWHSRPVILESNPAGSRPKSFALLTKALSSAVAMQEEAASGDTREERIAV